MSTRNIIPLLSCTFLSLLPIFAFAQTSPTPAPAPAPPSAAAPYDFKRQGIFDCNQNGAYAMSVGTVQAISQGSGTYVPVNDSAVTSNTAGILINTGTLVYKECVLREVIIRMREAATAAFGKQATVAILTGRDGKPRYVVNQRQEELNVSDETFLYGYLRDGTLQNLNPALQGPVTRALAQRYEAENYSPQNILTCPYRGDLKAAYSGQPQGSVWDALTSLGNPACNPQGAYYLGQSLAGERIAQAIANQQYQWNWGRGYYAVTDGAQNPLAQRVLTPSVNVQQSYQTILDSPVRQLERANDIGQMIGGLYAGLTTHIISDNRGLAGIAQGIGGRPSYLDQVVAQSSQGLRNAALNVAIQVLNAARQVEAAYFQAVNAIGTVLIQTAAQLHSAENQCWNLIIPKVCTSPLSPQNECTDGSGTTYVIATSTAGFANAVIASQITPLVAPTTDKISASQNALRLIDQLIQGVTNTASLDAQRLALQQLDSLVAQRLLHVQPDVNAVTKQRGDVQAAMAALVTDTVQKWADDPSPSVGWCNINNPAVVQAWKDRWKK